MWSLLHGVVEAKRYSHRAPRSARKVSTGRDLAYADLNENRRSLPAIAALSLSPVGVTNTTIDRLCRLRPGERFRYYSGGLAKDLDRSRQQGAGNYVELLELIDMTVRDLVREGRIRVEQVERRGANNVRLIDYIAIGRE